MATRATGMDKIKKSRNCQSVYIENLVKFRRVAFLICKRTDRHKNVNDRHYADRITSPTYRDRSKNL